MRKIRIFAKFSRGGFLSMTRGRKPKPTRLRVIQGNVGRRPLPAGEPQPKSDIPECPKHLNSKAKAEWRRLVKELAPLKLLTGLDRPTLAAYCVIYGRWQEVEEQAQAAPVALMATRVDGAATVTNWRQWLSRLRDRARIIRKFKQTAGGLNPCHLAGLRRLRRRRLEPRRQHRQAGAQRFPRSRVALSHVAALSLALVPARQAAEYRDVDDLTLSSLASLKV